MTKKCSKCGKRKPLIKFYFRKDTGKYRDQCKDCFNIICKKRYKNKKEDILKKLKIYRKLNHIIIAARKKKYREKNRQNICLKQKEWYKNNSNRLKKKACKNYKNNKNRYKLNSKQWKLNNPNKIQIININRRHRNRVIKHNISETNFTVKQLKIIMEVFGHQCFNCESSQNLTIDHFKPFSKGNSLLLGNAIILCRSCNSSKWCKEPIEYFNKHQFNRAKSLMRTSQQLFERT